MSDIKSEPKKIDLVNVVFKLWFESDILIDGSTDNNYFYVICNWNVQNIDLFRWDMDSLSNYTRTKRTLNSI